MRLAHILMITGHRIIGGLFGLSEEGCPALDSEYASSSIV